MHMCINMCTCVRIFPSSTRACARGHAHFSASVRISSHRLCLCRCAHIWVVYTYIHVRIWMCMCAYLSASVRISSHHLCICDCRGAHVCACERICAHMRSRVRVCAWMCMSATVFDRVSACVCEMPASAQNLFSMRECKHFLTLLSCPIRTPFLL